MTHPFPSSIVSFPNAFVLCESGEKIRVGDPVEVGPDGRIRKARVRCATCGREKSPFFNAAATSCTMEGGEPCLRHALEATKRDLAAAEKKAKLANVRADAEAVRAKNEASSCADAIRLAVERGKAMDRLRDERNALVRERENANATLAAVSKGVDELRAKRTELLDGVKTLTDALVSVRRARDASDRKREEAEAKVAQLSGDLK